MSIIELQTDWTETNDPPRTYLVDLQENPYVYVAFENCDGGNYYPENRTFKLRNWAVIV